MTELPTTFGKYFLTDKLAIGGMAEIFLAKLIGPGGFEKAMVIKQIHPALSSQRAFVDLFVAEAKTLVSLSQSNIVPIYELGVVDDTYFIAMEYVDGPTLWQLTEAVFARGETIAPAIAAHVAAEIAKGLDYAHRKGAGVIHRDLSPRNVMLTRDGEVKLVDFGIAVALGEGTDAGEGGLPTGSFPYMSPEQAARQPLSGQTDLFSLGVLTWEMLTGRRLFARADADATLAAVAFAPIAAPSSVVAAVPERLDAIVMRALERDPERRWSNAGELGAALQRFLADATDLRGARDLATLVARVCPPTVGALAAAGADAPATQHDIAEDDDSGRSGDGAGPSTQVVPRSRPRGKRKPTVREATFATHVELERVLGPVTPAMARGGPSAEPTTDAPAIEISAGDAPTGEYLPPTGTYAKPTPAPPAPAPARVDDPATTLPTMAPVRPGRLAAAALVAGLVAIGALYLTCRDHGATTAPIDASASVASVIDSGASVIDAGASVIDSGAGAIDGGASATNDARDPVVAPRDAHGPSPRDARDPTPPPRDAREPGPKPDAAAAATGVLRVGADPWGEVFLDGKRLGRAPNQWTVAAGRHEVEVVFPGDESEQRRRFTVEVPAGGADSVLADFRTP